MTIAESLDDLLKNAFGIPFFKPSLWLRLEVAMKRSATHVLHDEDHVLLSVDNLIQLNNTFMLHLLHQFYFSFHRFSSIGFFKLVLLIDFQSYLFI